MGDGWLDIKPYEVVFAVNNYFLPAVNGPGRKQSLADAVLYWFYTSKSNERMNEQANSACVGTTVSNKPVAALIEEWYRYDRPQTRRNY